MNPQILLLSASVPAGRVFGLDQQTLIQIGIQLINAGFLAVVLAFVLYKPVRGFMKVRSDRIKSQFEQAAADMAKAEELKKLYEEKLRDISSERNDILNMARETAEDRARQIVSDAKTEADAIRERATTDIKSEYERVQDEIREYIVEASMLMAGKFVTVSIDKETQDRLFSETVAELEEVTWQS